MKALNIVTAAVLSLGVMAAANAAGPINANKITKRGTVNYSCQHGRHVSVNYGFNAAGVPVTATAKLDGKTRVMKYDMRRSDDTGTYFKDSVGYDLGGDNINSRNFRKASILITAPDNEIIFKGCDPRTPRRAHR